MLKKTHIAIAKKISKDLELESKPTKLLINGSTAPDLWGNFPHHRRKEGDILRRIAKARIMFLQDDDEYYHELGIALHYLEDKWTLSPRVADEHTNYERENAKAPFTNDFFLSRFVHISEMPTKAINGYKKLLESLSKIKEEGINKVYNLSWSFWDSRYKYIPQIYHPVSGSMRIPDLNSWDTDGFARAIDKWEQKAMEPVITGYQAAINSLALTVRPSSFSYPILDLNIAYRIGLEITRYTLIPIKTLDKNDN